MHRQSLLCLYFECCKTRFTGADSLRLVGSPSANSPAQSGLSSKLLCRASYLPFFFGLAAEGRWDGTNEETKSFGATAARRSITVGVILRVMGRVIGRSRSKSSQATNDTQRHRRSCSVGVGWSESPSAVLLAAIKCRRPVGHCCSCSYTLALKKSMKGERQRSWQTSTATLVEVRKKETRGISSGYLVTFEHSPLSLLPDSLCVSDCCAFRVRAVPSVLCLFPYGRCCLLQKPDERLDDDLRRLLKRLPNSTKRHLLQDLSSPDGGSTRAVSTANNRGLNDRRASEPQFAVISEVAPLEEREKVGYCRCC